MPRLGVGVTGARRYYDENEVRWAEPHPRAFLEGLHPNDQIILAEGRGFVFVRDILAALDLMGLDLSGRYASTLELAFSTALITTWEGGTPEGALAQSASPPEPAPPIPGARSCYWCGTPYSRRDCTCKAAKVFWQKWSPLESVG